MRSSLGELRVYPDPHVPDAPLPLADDESYVPPAPPWARALVWGGLAVACGAFWVGFFWWALG